MHSLLIHSAASSIAIESIMSIWVQENDSVPIVKREFPVQYLWTHGGAEKI